MERFLISVAVLSSLAALSDCGRSDYLYYSNPQPAQVISTTHKIKELTGNAQADIVWQVGGMTELTDTLLLGADKFMGLVSKQSAMDWRMGVISTDPSDDEFLGFRPTDAFDAKTPLPGPLFHDAVFNVISSRDGEQMMKPVQKVLMHYPTFVRSNAILVVIVSNDNHDESVMDPNDFLKFLVSIKGDLSHVIVYGVFGSLDFGCQYSDDDPSGNNIDEAWSYAGSTYETIIKATHGKAFSLCTADFGTSLGKIGDDLVSRLNHPKIYLTSRPVPSSIQVTFHGAVLPGGPQEAGGYWSYDFDLNAVVFYNLNFAAADDEQVQITYSVDDGHSS